MYMWHLKQWLEKAVRLEKFWGTCKNLRWSKYNDKLRVCFDTCHVNDSGYDLVNDLSGTFTQFDKIIGADQIAVFHINDSKNPCGAGKDRHENIGFGNIGYDTLREIIYMKDFENVPKILETPYVKDPETQRNHTPLTVMRLHD